MPYHQQRAKKLWLPYNDMGMRQHADDDLILGRDLSLTAAYMLAVDANGMYHIVHCNPDGTISASSGASTTELVDANSAAFGVPANPLSVSGVNAATGLFRDFGHADFTVSDSSNGYFPFQLPQPFGTIMTAGRIVTLTVPGGGQMHLWLDTSHDGVNWFQIQDLQGWGGAATFGGAAGKGTNGAVNAPSHYVRLRYTGLNGGAFTMTASFAFT